jgi:hypothetical protein
VRGGGRPHIPGPNLGLRRGARLCRSASERRPSISTSPIPSASRRSLRTASICGSPSRREPRACISPSIRSRSACSCQPSLSRSPCNSCQRSTKRSALTFGSASAARSRSRPATIWSMRAWPERSDRARSTCGSCRPGGSQQRQRSRSRLVQALPGGVHLPALRFGDRKAFPIKPVALAERPRVTIDRLFEGREGSPSPVRWLAKAIDG